MVDASDLQLISGRLERGEIDSAQYLEQLTRFIAALIGCSRAGVRLFIDTSEGQLLRTVALYDSTLDRMVSAPDIADIDTAPYHARLLHDGSVLIANVQGDPAAAGPLQRYAATQQLASLMDMSFSVNGALFGTFTCEQIGAPVDWSQRQLQSLRKIASRASLTLMHLVSVQLDTAPGALWETSTPNRLVTMPMPLDALPLPDPDQS